ncbi:hypothetical protein GGR54DRAFT_621453 [Hypoxylon sp. NC1633]|nr:hypothetical protein GGR54DRAFT_621453 [Hypoxylon sp. NC1633]
MNAPFALDNDMVPKCEPRLLSIGDRFFSTNLGFPYEVASISRDNGNGRTSTTLPSIPYLNNTLQDCRTDDVKINFSKSDLSSPPDSWWISWGPSGTVTQAHCTVASESGPVNITLRVEYRGIGDHTYDYVIDDKYTSHASVWWGTRLLNAYWHSVMTIMAQVEVPGDDHDTFFNHGRAHYFWRDHVTEGKSIRDLDFFRLHFYFLGSNAKVINSNTFKDIATDNLTTLYNNASVSYSTILTEGLHFAKIMHSLVLVDLGNSHLPNLLLDDDSLQYALLAPDDMNRQPGGLLYDVTGFVESYRTVKMPRPGTPPDTNENLVLINESYNAVEPLVGPLGTRNATILSQYLCSVPERKSTWTMLVAVLIADLVFLQAAWKILNWTAESMVSKQDSTSIICRGRTRNEDKRNDKCELEGEMTEQMSRRGSVSVIINR